MEEFEDGPIGMSDTDEGTMTSITMRASSARRSRLVWRCAFTPADYEAVFADPDQMLLFTPAIATISTVLEKKSVANADAF